MSSIASALKGEIARVARKEIRAETQALKKASSNYRTQIAALRRRIQALEAQLKKVKKGSTRATPAAAAEDEGGPALRFSAKGLAAQRKRLGLSAAAVASILGVSAQSVYKWEEGKTRPRRSQLEAIATLRKMGKREANSRLSEAA